ncbi:MAG: hypothetical protein H6945_02920 [Zoogloeaceae bacterium]|nr:hypothetical protein [Rhodocyclaceae bacterium]MCP5234674.1 hypothetical protein [Zoogloeaceae bacterium]
MKTKIVRKQDGVEVQVSDVEGRTDRLLAAFRECQEGRCTCPTDEYRKVESVGVNRSGSDILLSIRAKAGRRIDVSEIERCLAHTRAKCE